MNEDIANILKSQIESLPFMDRVGGLVKVIRKQETTDKGTVVKSFPVDCGTTLQDCNTGKYKDLVPNSKYKSIHYFEDLGISISGQDQATFTFDAKIKLVGWLNLKKLGKDQCSVSALAIAAILKQIEAKTFNSGVFTRIQIRCTGVDPKTSAIFSKYSYTEEINQYLMFPYDYYAMTFTVNFTIPNKCIADWVSSIPINC
jgi:hypothetical protein